MTPDALPEAWRARAADLEPYAPPAAEAYRVAATELAEALQAEADKPLTLEEAAGESGYSKRRLRELVADGDIPNAGRKHAPRIRRADLPRKPGSSEPTPGSDYDLDEDAARLAGRVS